jgi:DNA-binding LacI/PurR family transcriptional regulator
MTEKRATLRDVAAAAGVSRATAGFVLSGSSEVTLSEATRVRVRQAAAELGYVPHGIARALREGSSRIVVLSIETGLEGGYSRSYVRGLDQELAQHDYVLLVRNGRFGPESEQPVLDAIKPRAVLRFAESYLEPGRELDDGGWQGGLAGNVAVQLSYLAERGHSGIAIALRDDDNPLTAVRLRFAAAAAEMIGLPPPESLPVPRQRADAGRAIRDFLGAHRAVTAMAAFDDEVALRVLAALHDLGLSAPGDLAVIGFDETEYGALSVPALTTVHIDAEEHGKKAARSILGLEADGFYARPARVVVRASALALAGDPAVGADVGGRGVRAGFVVAPLGGKNHARRHQVEATERQPREHVGVPPLGGHPALLEGALRAGRRRAVLRGEVRRHDVAARR